MNALKKSDLLLPHADQEVLSPQEMIRFARAHSPFYKKLYKDLSDIVKFQDVPVIPQDEFWTCNKMPKSDVLTGPLNNGIIFRSGGTTGNPKFSVFSHSEWKTYTETTGAGFGKNQIEEGDIIANLFHAGNMYGAFIFTTRYLEDCPVNVVQLPISAHIPNSDIYKSIVEFNANVIVSVPTTLMSIAEYIKENAKDFNFNQITKVFFAGEPLFDDQKERLKNIFPKVKIYSIGYASVDAGMMGYADSTCSDNEHRYFSGHTVIEIIDEKTNKVIEEENVEGLIVVTNLYRKLMPIIRYPSGDRGMWTEKKGLNPDRKFKLLGRSEELASISCVKFYVHDVREVLKDYSKKIQMIDFQLETYHKDGKDCLKLKIASSLDASTLKKYEEEITQKLISTRPLYNKMIESGGIAPLQIEWLKQKDLEINPRTGKIRRVMDKRT